MFGMMQEEGSERQAGKEGQRGHRDRSALHTDICPLCNLLRSLTKYFFKPMKGLTRMGGLAVDTKVGKVKGGERKGKKWNPTKT